MPWLHRLASNLVVVDVAAPLCWGEIRTFRSGTSYVIYDSVRSTVEFKSVDYDIDGAIEDILGNGLPEPLTTWLRKGI